MSKKKFFWGAKLFVEAIILLTGSISFSIEKSDLYDSSQTSSSGQSVEKFQPPPREKSSELYGFKSVLGSSVADRNTDLRGFKTGSDDSSDGTSSSSLPNKTSLIVNGEYQFLPTEGVGLFGMHTLAASEESSYVVRGPIRVKMPTDAFGLKYKHSFTPFSAIELRQSYVDVYGWTDPSLSLTYKYRAEEGWSYRGSLSASVPTTERSRKEHLQTKGTLRGSAVLVSGPMAYSVGMTLSEYKYGEDSDGSATGGAGGSVGELGKPKGKKGRGSPRGTGGTGGSPSDATAPVAYNMDEIDLILADRELRRASVSTGANYELSKSLSYGASLGLSNVETRVHNHLWYTQVKAADLVYKMGEWEIGSSLNFTSDIVRYQSPSMPNIMSVAVHLDFIAGNRDLVRR